MNTTDRMALQRSEFDAADAFTKALARHNATPIVDDDYPQVRHEYEGALAALVRAMKANGRFNVANRYALYTHAPTAASTGWSAEDACEAFIAVEVDSAPEALRRLGDWLNNALDEDQAKTASRMVLGAMMETSAAIRAVSAAPAADGLETFLAEVRAEVLRARAKFPGNRVITVALAEEFGEVCKAVLDESPERVRAEAVQLAAMTCRLVLDGDSSVVAWRAEHGLARLGDA